MVGNSPSLTDQVGKSHFVGHGCPFCRDSNSSIGDSKDGTDNWRQTGETRTHYLLAGALLLEYWIKSAAGGPFVSGPIPCLPQDLSCGSSKVASLTPENFLAIAERLTRDEVVHSLIELSFYPETSDSRDRELLRVSVTHGFSGPKWGDPCLTILPPAPSAPPQIIVLDDTGNRFRRTPTRWPTAITGDRPPAESLAVNKLHRPLPEPKSGDNSKNIPDQATCSLWSEVTRQLPPDISRSERRFIAG